MNLNGFTYLDLRLIIFKEDSNRLNNTHAKISASSLAESTSINPKQCRKLKLNAKR